jgi:hypothetical protein
MCWFMTGWMWLVIARRCNCKKSNFLIWHLNLGCVLGIAYVMSQAFTGLLLFIFLHKNSVLSIILKYSKATRPNVHYCQRSFFLLLCVTEIYKRNPQDFEKSTFFYSHTDKPFLGCIFCFSFILVVLSPSLENGLLNPGGFAHILQINP